LTGNDFAKNGLPDDLMS